MKYYICPSILSADFSNLEQDVRKVLNAGADRIHIDVMDNNFVPNLSFGSCIVKALRKSKITAPFDVHLMTYNVDNLIIEFAKSGASLIYFHIEAVTHIDRSLELIKSLGCEVGIALNPATPLNNLEYIIDKLDRILIMSVNPGFGGQKFIPSILQKITDVRKIINKSKRNIRLEVDGGVNINNIKSIAKAGADTFVSGSAIFNAKSYKNVIDNMRYELKDLEGI